MVQKILNEIVKEYTTNKNIYFIDDKIIRFPQDIDVTVNSTSLLISGLLKNNTSESFKYYNIYLDNALLARDFKLFKEFVIQNQYYYNETYTIHFLNNLQVSLD